MNISAQRVAYGDVTPTPNLPPDAMPSPVRLPALAMAWLALVTFGAGVSFAVWGRHVTGLQALQRFAVFDPLKRGLRRAARRGHLPQTRRYAAALLSRDGPSLVRRQLLSDLDKGIFNPNAHPMALRGFARQFATNRDPQRP